MTKSVSHIIQEVNDKHAQNDNLLTEKTVKSKEFHSNCKNEIIDLVKWSAKRNELSRKIKQKRNNPSFFQWVFETSSQKELKKNQEQEWYAIEVQDRKQKRASMYNKRNAFLKDQQLVDDSITENRKRIIDLSVELEKTNDIWGGSINDNTIKWPKLTDFYHASKKFTHDTMWKDLRSEISEWKRSSTSNLWGRLALDEKQEKMIDNLIIWIKLWIDLYGNTDFLVNTMLKENNMNIVKGIIKFYYSDQRLDDLMIRVVFEMWKNKIFCKDIDFLHWILYSIKSERWNWWKYLAQMIHVVDPEEVIKILRFSNFIDILVKYGNFINDKNWIKKVIYAFDEKYKSHKELLEFQKWNLSLERYRDCIKNIESDFNTEASLAYLKWDNELFNKYVQICNKALEVKHIDWTNSPNFCRAVNRLRCQSDLSDLIKAGLIKGY